MRFVTVTGKIAGLLLAALLVSLPERPAGAAPLKRLAQVRFIDGGLTVQPPHRQMRRGRLKMSLFNAYFLRTRAKERASIRFGDGTTLHFNQFTDALLKDAHLTVVQQGEVDEILKPGTSHKIQSATAIAGAIGTNFDIKVQGIRTFCTVVKGAVWVENARGRVEVQRNQQTVVEPGKKPAKPVKVDAGRATAWARGIPTPTLGENLALDTNGGQIVSVSSDRPGKEVRFVHDGRQDTAWETGAGQIANQSVKLGFQGTRPYVLSAVILDPGGGGYSSGDTALKDFLIKVSDSGVDESHFTTVLRGTLKQGGGLQTFPFTSPIEARYLELVELSNNGSADGIALAELEAVGLASKQPLFAVPLDVKLDRRGHILIADTGHNRIDVLSNGGALLATYGSRGSGPGEFSYPSAVASDSQGNIYVGDWFNNRIQKLSPAGKWIATWGGPGTAVGRFSGDMRLATDAHDNIYETDAFNHRVQKFSPAGVFLAQFDATDYGSRHFGSPTGIAVDGQGNIFVSDSGNSRVQMLSPEGRPIESIGGYGSGIGQLNAPTGVALDGQGNIYVGDSGNERIQKFGPGGQALAQWGTRGSGPGQFSGRLGLTVDAPGNIYVSDEGNNRLQKLSPSGVVLAIWK